MSDNSKVIRHLQPKLTMFASCSLNMKYEIENHPYYGSFNLTRQVGTGYYEVALIIWVQ